MIRMVSDFGDVEHNTFALHYPLVELVSLRMRQHLVHFFQVSYFVDFGYASHWFNRVASDIRQGCIEHQPTENKRVEINRHPAASWSLMVVSFIFSVSHRRSRVAVTHP